VTWVKTGTEFPDDALDVELTDAGYRTHHEAVTWLYKVERTDCYISAAALRRFAGSPHAEMAVQELVNLGWWRVHQQGYEVVHHGDVIRQSIAAQVKKREYDKKLAQRKRAKENPNPVVNDVSGDRRNDAVKQTDKQAGSEERASQNGGWPEVMQPGSGAAR